MEPIQSVGIREFRANLHKYTRQSTEVIAITSHGEPIGYYIPAQQGPEKQEFAALQEARSKIVAILKESGVAEEDIVADFQKARRNEPHS